MKKVLVFLVRYRGKLCAFAIGVAAIALECCRGSWYEPEEPEGLEEVLKKSGKVQ